MSLRTFGTILTLALPLAAQDAATGTPPPNERWNVYFQATSIGQYHGSFPAAYSGPLSLANHPEAETSLTSTIFFGFRIARNTQFYFDPEMAGGRGFSGTDGLANFSNGEMPRVEGATPKPYIARLYITQDFALGEERDAVESDENQLSGSRPARRYSITLGRFSATDFFQNTKYSNDPRTQFMGWATMYNGAWDYPADTRGYTWGWVHELHFPRWSFRYGSAAMPRVANGERFDRRLFRDRADMFEGELDGHIHLHPGAVRLLSYFNHAQMGDYAEAIRIAEETGMKPDVTATRRAGALKYGFGLSADQEITTDFGVFGRLGWNDGKTESFAFTAMDRLASFGVSLKGRRWNRPGDVVASAITAGGLSGVHAQYLALGGNDFLIGDGGLRYGPEISWESYYSARVFEGFFATIGANHYDNPAYNRDRGPLWVGTLRLHIEYGKK
ncbi:MAG TPA: carbohydrate porin [Bryobacteraceae bacterium]|nr:carbohydrate porin [Bryobacteraceae bacterium]